MYGHLYGIGVGPGDPELITLKAVRALQNVHVVLAAASTKNEGSLALNIAKAHLPADICVVQLGFPMSRDHEELKKSWLDNAKKTLEILGTGKNAAFLTLGDPLLYSTFGYLLQTIRNLEPQIPITIIPGITSFQAAAAKAEHILAEQEENLLILPGIKDEKELLLDLQHTKNAVILKAYTKFPLIRKSLKLLKNRPQATFVSRVGFHDEIITPNLEKIEAKPNYLSLLLIKNHT